MFRRAEESIRREIRGGRDDENCGKKRRVERYGKDVGINGKRKKGGGARGRE